MVELGVQERILKSFGNGVNAIKTYEEILEGLANKDLDDITLQTSLDNLVSLGKLGKKEFGNTPVYWLESQFTTTQLPHAATPTSHRSSGGARKGIRRPFVSPVISSVKKSRLEEDDMKRKKGSPKGSTPSSSNKELLLEQRQLLEKIKEKEVKLQQLKKADEMAKTGELDKLIMKWRNVSQEVAEQLLAKAQGIPPPTMGEMLRHLHIDPKLIQYSEEDESFY